MQKPHVVLCQRCGDPCRPSDQRASNARPFKRASRGFCAPCAVCVFLQNDGENGIGFAIPDSFDPEGLRLPHIQKQFAAVLAAGASELTAAEISWDRVIAKWNTRIDAFN